ncbi:MAG: phage major capsid protein, partial [Spirochaetales bacterium]|nr:phage major capsid protein [Spirochaetales bacterium]
MGKINEMRTQRAKTWEKAKAFLDERRNEQGILSGEDTATYERMEEEIVDLGREIERQERMEAFERELNAPVGKPITSRPDSGNSAKGKGVRATDEYRAAFWNHLRRRENTAPLYNALQVGVDSEGGYLVPDEFERTIVQALIEENIFRSIARIIHTSGGDRKIPISASKGEAAWIDEEGAYPESDDSFGQVTIGAYKVGTIIKVSEELINDSVFDIESYVAGEFARRIGAKEESAFFSGDGAGKPLGVLADTGGAQVGVTTASATAITSDEVIDLYHSLRRPYRKDAVWLINDATIKALRKLKDGNGQYIWQPALTEGAPDTLLGRPVMTSDSMPDIAAGAKSIA